VSSQACSAEIHDLVCYLRREVNGANDGAEMLFSILFRLPLWLIGTVRAEPETVISRAWVQSPARQTDREQ